MAHYRLTLQGMLTGFRDKEGRENLLLKNEKQPWIPSMNILSKDKRKKNAFRELESSKVTQFHLKVCFVSGLGFLVDSYHIFVISIVVPMLKYVYYPEMDRFPSCWEVVVQISTQLGIIIGLLYFGYMADCYGRKKIYAFALIIIMIGSLGSLFCANTVRGFNALTGLVFWRFIVGVGIGGDIPISGLIPAEFSPTSKRGTLIALSFAMQGAGNLFASVFAYILMYISKNNIEKDVFYVDNIWRWLFGIGSALALFTLFVRESAPETPRYTLEIKQDFLSGLKGVHTALKGNMSSQESEDKARELSAELIASLNLSSLRPNYPDLKEVFEYFRRNSTQLKTLLCLSLAWFTLDFGFYGISLNSPAILGYLGYADGDSNYVTLQHVALGNMILNLIGGIPGIIMSLFIIDRVGRVKLQAFGFISVGIVYLMLGVVLYLAKQDSIKVALSIALFAAVQFLINLGPNVTLFVLGLESFPTRYRGISIGICASFGKLGSILSQISFVQLEFDPNNLPLLLSICGVMMIIGFIATLNIVETKGKPLPEDNLNCLKYEDN